MWYVQVTIYPGSNVFWRASERERDGDGLVIKLVTGMYSDEPYDSASAATMFGQTVTAYMEHKTPKWMIPGYNEWVFDLDSLKKTLPELNGVPWLGGTVALAPKIEISKQNYARDESSAAPDYKYHAQATFTIYAHTLGSGDKLGAAIPDVIQKSLERFQGDHPNPSTVAFIMMNFSGTESHRKIEEAVKKTLLKHGITGLTAKDKTYNNDLYGNVLTYIYGCGFGIALFEIIKGETSDRYNPNVALEVGYMFGLGKEVCLMKDAQLRSLPADILGQLYKSFDFTQALQTIPPALEKWLQDKNLARYNVLQSEGTDA
jgi:hypothetical protein